MADVAQAPFPLTFGTYEDARKLIGQAGEKTVAEFSVTQEAIKAYCALVEDANASYWDEAYAQRQWSGIVAPPGLLLSWCMALRVPLPGDTLINVATTTEFDRHLYLGDRVSVQDRLTQISEEKDTRLGIGHFLTTEAEFVNQQGERVAVQTNQLFRYRTHEA